jgi:hypothetical protein
VWYLKLRNQVQLGTQASIPNKNKVEEVQNQSSLVATIHLYSEQRIFISQKHVSAILEDWHRAKRCWNTQRWELVLWNSWCWVRSANRVGTEHEEYIQDYTQRCQNKLTETHKPHIPTCIKIIINNLWILPLLSRCWTGMAR